MISQIKRNGKNRILVSAALAAAAASAATALSPRPAAGATWTGGGTTGSWLDPSNWGGTAPVPPEPLNFDTSNNLNTIDDFPDLTTFSGFVFNPGAGSFILAGSNRVALVADVVNNSGSSQLISLPLTLGSTFNFTNNGGPLTISGVISDNGSSGGLNVNGAGTLTLSGNNTYSGPTIVTNGTLAVGSGGSLGNGNSALTLGVASTGTIGNLDLTNGSATVASLTVATNTTTANAITIGSGKSLTVTGATTIGNLTASPANTVVTATGGGTLTLGNGTGSLILNNYTANNGAQTSSATIDASGLGTFVANVGSAGTIAIGGSTTIIGPHGAVILGGDNTLTAGTMLVGLNVGSGSSGNRSNGYIKLGTTNKINVDNMTLGGGKPSNPGAGIPVDSIVFNNTAATGQTVKFRGSNGLNGTPVTSIKIADATGYTNNSATASVGTMDFTGGSLDMLVSSLQIGLGKAGANTAATNATLTFTAGTINATNIILAVRGNSAGAAATTGNLNVNGTGVVNAAAIKLGDHTIAGGGTATGNLNINSGSVTMTGNISGGGGVANVNLNGGTLNMQGNSMVASGSNVLLNAQSGTLLNVGQINGGTTGFTKSGTGVLTLNGTNTYGGTTTVSNGTLLVLSSVPSTDNVSGGTLAGTGNGGNVVLSSSGVVYPGLTAGDIQTLNANSLSVTGGSLKFDLGSSLTADLFNITGAASFTGASTINIPAAAPTTGLYTVLNATGTLTLTTLPTVVGPGGAFLYSLDTSDPHKLKINVTPAPTPLTWNGFQDQTTWVIGGPSNWTNGTSNTFYSEPALVTFNDTAPANATNITLNTSVSPASATFNSDTNNYTVSGSGSISGAAQLIKSGTSTLTLLTNNTYGGPTTINAGTVMVGNGGTIGSLGTGSITNNGVLVYNRSDSVTLAGAISGTGDLQQSGAGTLILTGNSTYSGVTTINSGTLQIGNGGATGAIGGGAVTNNSLLVFNRSGSLTATNVISGTGSLSVTGGVVLTLTGASTYAGDTNITGGSTVSVTSLPAATGASGVGAGTNTTAVPGAINLDGGTLRWARVGGNQTSDRTINIGAGGATIDASPVASQSLTLSTAIGFIGPDGARTLTLTGLDPASTNFNNSNMNGLLVDPTGGSLSIVKNGVNGWTLGNGANSFTGSITVNAGSLRTGASPGDPLGPFGNNSAGSATSIAVANGAQVRFNNTGTFRHPISIAGVGVPANELLSFYGAISITTGGVELAGPITLTGDARITARAGANVSATISGPISGAHALELGKAGQNGFLLLTNTTNSWSGGTQISMGTTQVGAPSTLTGGVIPHGAGVGNVTVFGGDENGDGTNSTFDIAGLDTTINGLNSTGLLNRDVVTSTGAGTLTVGDGNANGSYAGSITNAISIAKMGNGTQTLSGNYTYTGMTSVSGGTLALTKTYTAGSGVTLTGGALKLLSDGTNNVVLKTPSISAAGTGKLDVNDNKVIVPNGIIGTVSGGVYDGITGLVQSGYNPATSPRWDGASGIVTTQTTATTGNLTSIGVALASDVRPNTISETALWGGQTIAGTDVLVMYTYGGDATLDGKINIDDYVKIDTGIAAGLSGWVNGDFNYDGKVNIDDYTTVIDANIGNQTGIFPTASGGPASAGPEGVTAVPEPAIGATIFLLGALTALRRQRRRIG